MIRLGLVGWMISLYFVFVGDFCLLFDLFADLDWLCEAVCFDLFGLQLLLVCCLACACWFGCLFS